MNENSSDPHRYDDIINLPHPVSKNHPQMSMENRAAQFSPFAALVGYDAAIKETARLTDKRIELDDDDKIRISGKLQLIEDNIKTHPEVTVTFFQPDEHKDGGSYVDATGSIKKVDVNERVILMTNGKDIPIDEVIAIDGELFGGVDEYFI